jgi:hypothetical protein
MTKMHGVNSVKHIYSCSNGQEISLLSRNTKFSARCKNSASIPNPKRNESSSHPQIIFVEHQFEFCPRIFI